MSRARGDLSPTAFDLAERALAVETAERSALLDRSCGEDPALRRRVGSLLKADALAGGFMAAPAAVELASPYDNLEVPGMSTSPGRRIGAYQVLRRLGSGGFGDVFLAERADEQFNKLVAIKVLGKHRFDDESRRRIVAERQILARLEHPGIARLYDGGTTADGYPYLVMEFVDGMPIDAYCEHHELPLGERLELFQKLCAAVQFAHQSFIVHRDLKPSNILVTADGQLKLLDFGIAKALSPDPSEGDGGTTRYQPMTLSFASPEQVRGEPITTATDVYGLGVVLYRLLCGTYPFELSSLPPHEVAARICDTTPRPPSRVAPQTRNAVPTAGSLKGDLDCIVLKALEKSPDQRYGSVDRLAADIEAYRRHLPIQARPRSLGYRLRKAVWRHRGLAIVVGIAGLWIALFMAMLIAQTRRANREAERANGEAARANREAAAAEEVAGFLVGVFQVFDPSVGSGATVTARELLDQSARRATSDLKAQPPSQARILETVGRAYLQLGLVEEASGALGQALEIRTAEFGEGSEEVVDTLYFQAETLWKKGDLPAAEAALSRALETSRGLDDAERIAGGLHGLAVVSWMRGELEKSEALSRETLAVRRQVLGDSHIDVARTLTNLGLALADLGKPEEALRALQESIAIQEALEGSNHLDTARDRGNVATILAQLGRSDEAEALMRQNIAIWREAFGGEPNPVLGGDLVNLGILVFGSQRVAEADLLLTEGLEVLGRLYGPEHPWMAVANRWLAEVRLAQGKPAEARALADGAARQVRAAFGVDHPLSAECAEAYGRILRASGDTSAAREQLQLAFDGYRNSLNPGHPDLEAFCRKYADICRGEVAGP